MSSMREEVMLMNFNGQNPKWMEVALHESYLLMNCGKFGKKLAKEAILVIYWCRKNLSEKEINSIVKKAKITKEKIFG